MTTAHEDQRPDNGIHTPISFTYANETDRENHSPATGPADTLSTDDIYKLALQTDNDSLWILINNSPITWAEVTNVTPGTPPADVAPPVVVVGGASVLGSEDGQFAREDHTHGLSTAAAVGLNANSTNTEGAASTAARSNHTHALDTTTGTISTVEAGDAASGGSAAGLARRDHQHAVATGVPVALGSSAAEGSGTNLARASHVHPFINHYQGVKATQVNTTGTDTQAARFEFNPLPAGSYTLFWSAEIYNTADTGFASLRIQIDDSTTIGDGLTGSPIYGDQGNRTDEADFAAIAGSYHLAWGGGNIDIDFDLSQIGDGTAQIRNMRVTLVPCTVVAATVT